MTISDAIKPAKRRSADVAEWFSGQDISALFLSSVTIGEIGAGLEGLLDGSKKRTYEGWFAALHEQEFAGRIIPFDLDAALVYRAVAANVQRSGWHKHSRDMQNAAVALLHGLCIVTSNVRDYDRCGAALLNPWDRSTWRN